MIVPFFISHQGCPHQCLFCDQGSITGELQPLPTAGTIRSTIARFRETSDSTPLEVAFFGGTFTMLPRPAQESLLDPLQPLIADGTVSSVRLSTRPDAIDREGASFLRDRGVRTVELGVQSLDDYVLAASGRGHSARDVRGAVALLHEASVAVGIQLMPGLPGSSAGSDLASLEEALGLSPAFIRIYPALVIAGTGLAALHEAGRFMPLSLDAAVRLSATMLHRSLATRVPVVRIGLQASDSLSEPGKVVAGPYHPAFRQLVESQLCLWLIRKLVGDSGPGARVIVRCAPSRVSDVIGQRRSNLAAMAAAGIVVERVEPDGSLEPMELIVTAPSGERRGNIVTDLTFDKEGNPYA